MTTVEKRVEEIKSKGYELDFGTVFNHAFENYKKIALYAGSMILVFLVVMAILITGGFILAIGMPAFIKMANPENLKTIESLVGINLILYLGSMLALGLLIGPFFAGFLKMAHSADKDEAFTSAAIFEYYKAPYFLQIIISSLIISVFNMTISLLLNRTGILYLGTLSSLIINFITLLTVAFIVFGKLNALDAIKASITVVLKNPITILALTITAFIGSLVGFIGCCIGVFFTLPIMYSMTYALYNAIIGFETKKID
ncbi:hypothetical protein [Flavobacterium sp. PL002]|uniref:hypothetical protein n=1 Tax=Flavobacterium sp. PL002 TaxID=1897058 RepID=UPI001787DB9C|nr:hypothetical protein [Flavobacterium sp. PL002]MBE0391861.1 hypothetical protein [Flavobacterium sp. PL002]